MSRRSRKSPLQRPASPAARDLYQAAHRLLRAASLELARLRRIRGAYLQTARRTTGARLRLAFAAGLLGVPMAEAAGAAMPSFASPRLIPIGVDGWASPDFADIDGDGDLDGLVGELLGSTNFFENTGTASAPAFAAPAIDPFGLTDVGFNASPDFADIDGDGDLDAFVGENSGDLFFFENTGGANAPAFAVPLVNPYGLEVGSIRVSPKFADLDADGDLDALVGDYYGNTSFLENTGTASAPAFAAPSTDPFGLSFVGGWAFPDFADIDGDGDLDAFVSEFFGSTRFFENTGTATVPAFAAPAINPFGLENIAGGAPSPDIADLDGDGDLDALFGDFYGNTILFENVPEPAGPMSLFSGILAIAGLGRRRGARGSSGGHVGAVGASRDLESDVETRRATTATIGSPET